MTDLYKPHLNIFDLDVSIQKLASNFHCGNSFIDRFIQSSQALDNGFGKTYVWLEEEGRDIIGFYNISVGSIDQYDGLAYYKIGGSIHINEFALSQKYQGVPAVSGFDRRLSDLLLTECLERIKNLREHHVGFSFVTLQSTKEGKHLYARNDFKELEEDMNISKLQAAEEKCTPMYLALDLEESETVSGRRE